MEKGLLPMGKVAVKGQHLTLGLKNKNELSHEVPGLGHSSPREELV